MKLQQLFKRIIDIIASLARPRPLLVEYIPLYSYKQWRRHEVKPGITGLAQVSGRNNVDWEDRFNIDIDYVDNFSLILDFKILFKTISKVIKRDGINQEGNATMEKFKGSN